MQNLENELKERLTKGVYGDIYNVPFKEFGVVLDMEKGEVAPEEEEEEVSIVLSTCRHGLFLCSLCSPALTCVHLIKQEGEMEYVEGDDMEEMDDMEDMEDFEGLSDGKDVLLKLSMSCLMDLEYFIINCLGLLVC